MDFFVASTIILAIWAALGPLIGVRYGQELARRSQKEHWIAENRKHEYRELIEAIVAHFEPVNRGYGPGGTLRAPSEAAIREVMDNRLFIATDLQRLRVKERWKEAVARREGGGSPKEFEETFRQLCDELREAVLKTR